MGEWGTVGTRKMLEQRKERWGEGAVKERNRKKLGKFFSVIRFECACLYFFFLRRTYFIDPSKICVQHWLMAFAYAAETVFWIFGSLDVQQYGGLCGTAMNPASNKADLWDKHTSRALPYVSYRFTGRHAFPLPHVFCMLKHHQCLHMYVCMLMSPSSSLAFPCLPRVYGDGNA